MNKKHKRKYRVGETVQVKPDLKIGAVYYNEGSSIGDVFSYRMKEHLGKEAKIEHINNDKYILDIDRIHSYTDEMLRYPIDELAESEYEFNGDVELIIRHVEKQRYYNMIDKALDEGLHEKDVEAFRDLVKKYNSII